MDTITSFTKQDEWKECRSTIARFDTTIADFRKYSFTVITGLITAGSLLGGQQADPGVKVAVPVAIMLLITALFVVDRYYRVLQGGAVLRAVVIEHGPRIPIDLNETHLTQVMSIAARRSLSVILDPFLYGGLLYATWKLGSAMAGKEFLLANSFGPFSQSPSTSADIDATFEYCLILISVYFLASESLRRIPRQRHFEGVYFFPTLYPIIWIGILAFVGNLVTTFLGWSSSLRVVAIRILQSDYSGAIWRRIFYDVWFSIVVAGMLCLAIGLVFLVLELIKSPLDNADKNLSAWFDREAEKLRTCATKRRQPEVLSLTPRVPFSSPK